jgi:hypothetical protein
MPGQTNYLEWKPSERPLLVAGPVRVPEINNSSNIHFPNIIEIMRDEVALSR